MADGGMVNKNLSSIPRGMANLEAEKGEVAMTDLGKTGVMGLYNIGGQRHSNGGTPLNLDPGSFIYSDTRKMKIKDPEFLAKYGKTKPITPAKLVKPFLGINDFTNTLYDQTADPIQKRTAQSMIDKYKGKAGEIAFYQEAMKGFPQGVPAVAEDYAEGIMGAPMMAYGGYLPEYQTRGQVSAPKMSTADKKARFVQEYGPIAQKVGAQFGIDPSIILAQAAQESGWGTSSLFKRSNNLFGVMASGKPNDYWAGARTPANAGKFRVYSSAENSMADFARLIKDKYKSAYNVADDPKAYAKAIANSPYISEANGDNREIYERNVRNNALEIQRLLPEAMQLPPGDDKYVRMPNRSSPTSGDDMPYFPLPRFVSGLDNDVMDIYLQIDSAQRAARRDMGQTQFFTPSRQIPYAPSLEMPFDPVNNPRQINYAVQSAIDVPAIVPYAGGRTETGRMTPTGVENRFERVLPDYLTSWQKFIPGIADMSNEQAQSAIYDYLVENEPDAVRNMWGTYGNTAKGKKDSALSNKYPSGTIDPKELTDEDLKNLKSAYTDGLFGVRQMDPLATPEPTITPTQTLTPTITPTQTLTPTITPTFTPNPKNKTYRFQQDVNNLNTNTANQLSERKYFPFAPRLTQTPFDPTYLDDTRQQQQIAGRARGTMEALGAFTGPGRQASMASSVAGQAAEQSLNSAAMIGNQNVGISNWANQFNAQMKNQRDTINAASAKGLYDDTVRVQDTYDEKMRSYRTRGTELENAMETNLARAKLFNQLYPDFQINTAPGMYGEITANPEVLKSMQDVGDYAEMDENEKRRVQNAKNRAFDAFAPSLDKDGKDQNLETRNQYFLSLLENQPKKQALPPFYDIYQPPSQRQNKNEQTDSGFSYGGIIYFP
jgi:flagellar protein FlgJ